MLRDRATPQAEAIPCCSAECVRSEPSTSPKGIAEWYGSEGSSEDHLVHSPAKAGSLQRAAQQSVQAGFEYPHGRRLRTLSGQPGPLSDTLTGKTYFEIKTGTSLNSYSDGQKRLSVRNIKVIY